MPLCVLDCFVCRLSPRNDVVMKLPNGGIFALKLRAMRCVCKSSIENAVINTAYYGDQVCFKCLTMS